MPFPKSCPYYQAHPDRRLSQLALNQEYNLLRRALHHDRLRLLQLSALSCGRGWYRSHGGHRIHRLPGITTHPVTLVPFSENHFSGGGLQNRCYRDIDGLADHLSRVVHHHHGSIVEIGHALVVLFAFLQNENFHGFAGQDNRFQRVSQFVDVQHGHSLQLRDFVQVEIVGDDFAFIQLGQFDQFQIHFADRGEIIFDDLNLQGRDFLQTLQDVEAAAAPVSFQRVGGVCDQLQFAQHELRSYDDAVEKTGFGDVRDPAVNNDAGIEDLVAFLALPLASKDASQSGQVEQVAVVGADHQADVCHEQHH